MQNYFTSKESCIDKALEKKVNSNEKYPFFYQAHFTAGDEDQFHNIVSSSSKLIKDDKKIDTTDNIFTEKIEFNFWKKYQNANHVSRINTFRYIFYKFKKAIFVKIHNNKIDVFLPFDNTKFHNEWSGKISIPSKFKNIKEYLQSIDSRNRPENITGQVEYWYANNCLLRYESPASYEDTNVTNMHDMLIELCKHRSIPDIEFFINRRDFPIITRDETEAYFNLFGHDQKLVSHNYETYAPILSQSIDIKQNADIMLPTGDDWARVESKNNKYFKKFCERDFSDDYDFKNWDQKIPTAIFRGSSTGCGVDVDENVRLKLSLLSVQSPVEDKIKLLDAGITKWNTRIRKLAKDSYLHTIDTITLKNKYGITLTPSKSPKEQSKYKYIINADGHVSAFRLSLELSMGCCLLLVESTYTIWFRNLLVPYVHFVPVKRDLSDLYDQIRWCRKNDDKCKQIAENAREFYDKYIDKNGIFDYLQLLFIKLSEFTKSNKINYVTSKQNEYSQILQSQLLGNIPSLTLKIPGQLISSNYSYQRILGWIIRKVVEDVSANNKIVLVNKELKNNFITSISSVICDVVQYNNKQEYNRSICNTLILNTLRLYIPNFQYIYFGDTSKQLIYYENNNGITLLEYIKSANFKFSTFIFILIQLCFALNTAQCFFSFCHTDLNPKNIILQFKKTKLEYKISYNQVIRFETDVIPIITNFSDSTVIYNNLIMNKYYGSSQTSGYDMYTLVVHSLIPIIEKKNIGLVKNILELVNVWSKTKITDINDAYKFVKIHSNTDQYFNFYNENINFIQPMSLVNSLKKLTEFKPIIDKFQDIHFVHPFVFFDKKIIVNENDVNLVTDNQVVSLSIASRIRRNIVQTENEKKIIDMLDGKLKYVNWKDVKFKLPNKVKFSSDCDLNDVSDSENIVKFTLMLEDILTNKDLNIEDELRTKIINYYKILLDMNKFNNNFYSSIQKTIDTFFN